MEQEQLSIPEHLISPSVLVGFLMFVVFYVVFYRSLFFPLSVSLGHCVVCPSPTCGARLHLSNLQAFHVNITIVKSLQIL